uniref:carboxypeptidase-like regulatory domain-containing protein n=2 Tax=Vibrio rotiferianus TaxID=190895 RepID=UPI001D12DC1C|nr:carboxypeptidase-like regulatory domain-containing protein [Vibrio rotiferianus]
MRNHLLLLVFFTFQGIAKPMEFTLSPIIQGSINQNGTPIGGLKIERTIVHNGVKTDTVITDENGDFSFNPVLLPPDHKQHSLQDIRVKLDVSTIFDGNEVTIWQSKLHTYQVSEPIIKSLRNLNCNLVEPLKVFSYPESKNEPVTNEVYSICSQSELKFEELY